jgi:hypothetical protein
MIRVISFLASVASLICAPTPQLLSSEGQTQRKFRKRSEITRSMTSAGRSSALLPLNCTGIGKDRDADALRQRHMIGRQCIVEGRY